MLSLKYSEFIEQAIYVHSQRLPLLLLYRILVFYIAVLYSCVALRKEVKGEVNV